LPSEAFSFREGGESCHGASLPACAVRQGGYGALFAVFALHSFSEGGPGTNFAEHYACRSTNMNGAANLSPVTKLVAGTGAVSGYKLSRSQKFVTVQDLNCVQMRALAAIASAKAGVRVQRPLQICLEGRSKSKKCDNCASRSLGEGWTTYPYCPC